MKLPRRKTRKWWTSYRPTLSRLNTPVGTGFVHYAVARPKDLTAKNVKAFMRGIEAFHRNQGYAAIAYHTMVFKDGRRVEGRPASKAGGATMDWNSRSVAVCAALDADDKANDKMETAFVREFRRFVRKGHLKRDPDIRPHSAVRQTSCPGASLKARVDDIRRRVRGMR